MITPERLQEIIDETPEHEIYLLAALKEFQTLRQQNKELLADAKRLFVLVEDYEKHTHVIGTGDVKEQHTALMEKIAGK